MNNDTLFPVATLIFVVIYIISNFLDIPMFKRSITDHSLKVSGVEDDSNFLKKMVSYFLHRRKYKKIRMTAIATGYFYAQNSGLNNTLIYKQIWDDIYDQELDDKQVAEFFTYFKKGKTYKFPQVAELFTENRENDRIATFTRIVSIFFMDNLLSPKEIDLYYRFGKTVELSKQVLDRLFTSFINKYSFVKDEDSNCYRSYLFEEDYFADGAWARTATPIPAEEHSRKTVRAVQTPAVRVTAAGNQAELHTARRNLIRHTCFSRLPWIPLRLKQNGPTTV